jgi:hypothetical protein
MGVQIRCFNPPQINFDEYRNSSEEKRIKTDRMLALINQEDEIQENEDLTEVEKEIKQNEILNGISQLNYDI